MKTALVSKEDNHAKFTITFAAEEIDEQKIKVYQATKDQFEIDGFRKGKAPRSIIEKKYGQGIFTNDAIDQLLEENYANAVRELELEVVEPPRTEFEPYEEGQDLVVNVTVAVYPEFTLENYKGVEVEEESTEVEEEDVDRELQILQYRNARLESVDRAAEEGDVVILDFEGSIDGELFEGGAAENYSLKLGSGSFIPGFEEQLVGMKAEETKDVKVTFPEDYQAEDLAGKDAVFKCTIHEVKMEELPELDDEFAKDVSEYDTLEELKDEARNRIAEEKKNTAENIMKDAIVRKLAETNDIDVPEGLVEQELNDMFMNLDNQMRQQGWTLQDYLSFAGKEVAEFQAEMRENAVRRVENRMIIRAVADQEDFEVTEEDITAQVQMMAEQFGLEEERIREIVEEEAANMGNNMLIQDVKMQKAIDFLYENAVKVPKKEA